MTALAIHRSRKLIPEFRLHRPHSAAEAAAIQAELGPGAALMAGGIDLVNRMKSGAPVSDLIYLGGIAGLDGVAEDEDGLRLGALLTHDRLAAAAPVRARLPALAETWLDVANIRIRCKGTIGGNIMAGDPGYDFALAALAANARLHFLAADGGSRVVGAAEPGATAGDGLLTAIGFPACRLVFDRSLRPAVSLAIGLDSAGGRVAIGCAYARPVAVALPLAAASSPAGLAEAVAAALPAPVADHNASAGYRRRMIAVLLRRALEAML